MRSPLAALCRSGPLPSDALRKVSMEAVECIILDGLSPLRFIMVSDARGMGGMLDWKRDIPTYSYLVLLQTECLTIGFLRASGKQHSSQIIQTWSMFALTLYRIRWLWRFLLIAHRRLKTHNQMCIIVCRVYASICTHAKPCITLLLGSHDRAR